MHDLLSVVKSTPRQRDGLQVREVDGETVILDRDNCLMHSLNPPAAFIFAAMDGLRTIDQIARDLASTFEIPFERAAADTRGLLDQLWSLKLLA
jgi:hypothetical protein